MWRHEDLGDTDPQPSSLSYPGTTHLQVKGTCLPASPSSLHLHAPSSWNLCLLLPPPPNRSHQTWLVPCICSLPGGYTGLDRMQVWSNHSLPKTCGQLTLAPLKAHRLCGLPLPQPSASSLSWPQDPMPLVLPTPTTGQPQVWALCLEVSFYFVDRFICSYFRFHI